MISPKSSTILVSALVPTTNRPEPLGKLLASLAEQSVQPIEIIIVDASVDDATADVAKFWEKKLTAQIIYQRARVVGAARQREQALEAAGGEAVLFMDDDIVLLNSTCLANLWEALTSAPAIGGVNAMIENQRYLPPGTISRAMFRLLHGRHEESYAGRCIGPAVNLLPEDDDTLPDVVDVEWLNTTCTMYRRTALPEPLFPSLFKGYSLMEDLALSLAVGKSWRLCNARNARIYHDSQPGDHKSNVFALSKMEIVNRHYVMREILERRGFSDYLKLAVFESFGILSMLRSRPSFRQILDVLRGKLSGLSVILSKSGNKDNETGLWHG